MEEAQTKKQLLPDVKLIAAHEEVFIEARICSHQIGFDTTWWLNGYFETVLQDGHRKLQK
jgi:hypothetical protein